MYIRIFKLTSFIVLLLLTPLLYYIYFCTPLFNTDRSSNVRLSSDAHSVISNDCNVTLVPIQHPKTPNTWLTVNASVNGHPTRLLVDTGAGHTVLIRASRYGRLGIVTSPTTERIVTLFSQAATQQICNEISIEIGGLKLVSKPCQIMNLEPLLSPLDGRGEDVEGILGTAYLDYYSAVIDFRGDLRLREPPSLMKAGLQGEWVGVELLSLGKKHRVDHAGRYRLTFRDADLTVICENYKAEYEFVRINPDADPAQIDLVTRGGGRSRGLYRLVDGRLHFSFPLLPSDDFDARATGFEPSVGAKYTTLVLEKVPAAPK